MPDWIEDERYADARGRYQNMATLVPAMIKYWRKSREMRGAGFSMSTGLSGARYSGFTRSRQTPRPKRSTSSPE